MQLNDRLIQVSGPWRRCHRKTQYPEVRDPPASESAMGLIRIPFLVSGSYLSLPAGWVEICISTPPSAPGDSSAP